VKIVQITWLDSKGISSQWEYLDEVEPLKPSECLSVGFLIEDAEEYKTIAQSLNDTQVLGRTTIPCCSIQSIVELKS